MSLKPCPFCDQKPERTTNGTEAICRTGNCALEGIPIKIKAWNSRAKPNREAELVEALEAINKLEHADDCPYSSERRLACNCHVSIADAVLKKVSDEK